MQITPDAGEWKWKWEREWVGGADCVITAAIS